MQNDTTVCSDFIQVVFSAMLEFMKPVIQQDTTGCAIACAAALANISYRETKNIASNVGISVNASVLWSETILIRNLLATLNIKTTPGEKPFTHWSALPDCALLAIKWHLENDTPFWHWVVFVREKSREYVLDSSPSLKNNVRTDFGRIHPKWSIAVKLLGGR